MKILMVNYEYPPLGGGGGVAMQDIASELALNHKVHVLTSAAPGLPEVEKVEARDLTIFRAKVFQRTKKSVASIPSMLSFYPSGIQLGKKLIQEYSYDVMNTWFAIPSGPTGIHLAKKFDIPHLLTIIGGDIYDPSKWYSPHRNPILGQVVKYVLRNADRHTAISQDVAKRAYEQFNFRAPIETIPLGVNSPQFPPAGRAELGLEGGTFYLVTVGRLVRRKDHPTLLRALSKLNRADVKLLVLGDGPELGNLQSLTESLGISNKVEFRGFVSEEMKYQLLSNSDAFVLTSLHEGFGLVYLEAMHCGLPVITTVNGGQEDFLQDGKTGFLITAGDCDNLSEKIEVLIGNSEIRRTIGDANRLIAGDFSVVNTAKNYADLLKNTTDTKRAS